MPTWLVTVRDASGKQHSVGVKAQRQTDAEDWARRWGHNVAPVVAIVSSRVMTPDEERRYGGVIDADVPGERA